LTGASQPFRLTRWTGEFAEPVTELAYRQSTRRDAALLNRVAITIAVVSAVSHIATDYVLYGPIATFFYLLGLRLTVGAMLLLVYPITAPTRPIAQTDIGIFALQLIMISVFSLGMLVVPPEFLAERVSVQSVTALMILIAQYLFIANRLPYVTAAGLTCSILYLGVTIAIGRLNPAAIALEAGVHAIANLLGVLTVWRTGMMRRRQFALAAEDAKLNQRLEAQARQLEAQAQELERARDEALQANRAKSEFIAYMSHELRSPMNAIIGFSEMMKREVFGRVSPPKYREYAEDIHGSATHLLSLINDILDLSKAEAGKLQLHEGEVDLAAAVEAARRLVAMRAEALQIALRTQLAMNLPLLAGDERLVKQMILNLLSNAIKFTPARGSVTISAGQEGGRLFVSVADTGPGIAAADIPRILEAYGRTDSAEKTAVEGTGLGLPLVKTMIELHGGSLAIESQPGAGSTFTLRFPPERTTLAKAA
jgi:two-component system cell cycle sensor histidine kinase PleC